MRIYTYLDVTSFVSDATWSTFFNSRAPNSNVNSYRSLDEVNRCCPMVSLNSYTHLWYKPCIIYIGIVKNRVVWLSNNSFQFKYQRTDPVKLNSEIQQNSGASVERISCNMPQGEFIEKYVRTLTPVLIQGCDFKWADKLNLSLPSAAKVVITLFL